MSHNQHLIKCRECQSVIAQRMFMDANTYIVWHLCEKCNEKARTGISPAPTEAARPEVEPPYALINAVRAALKDSVPTPGGNRTIFLRAKDYYRLLELADEAGALPSPVSTPKQGAGESNPQGEK